MELEHIGLIVGGVFCETRVHCHAADSSRPFVKELKLKLVHGSAIVEKYQVLFHILHEGFPPEIRRSKRLDMTFSKVRIVNNLQLD